MKYRTVLMLTTLLLILTGCGTNRIENGTLSENEVTPSPEVVTINNASHVDYSITFQAEEEAVTVSIYDIPNLYNSLAGNDDPAKEETQLDKYVDSIETKVLYQSDTSYYVLIKYDSQSQ